MGKHITHISSLFIRCIQKIVHATTVYGTYCLGHRKKKMKERLKTSD